MIKHPALINNKLDCQYVLFNCFILIISHFILFFIAVKKGLWQFITSINIRPDPSNPCKHLLSDEIRP